MPRLVFLVLTGECLERQPTENSRYSKEEWEETEKFPGIREETEDDDDPGLQTPHPSRQRESLNF